jgi:hypothetical protein
MMWLRQDPSYAIDVRLLREECWKPAHRQHPDVLVDGFPREPWGDRATSDSYPPEIIDYLDELAAFVANTLHLTCHGRAPGWAMAGVHLDVLEREDLALDAVELAEVTDEVPETPRPHIRIDVEILDPHTARVTRTDMATGLAASEEIPSVSVDALSLEFPFGSAYVGFDPARLDTLEAATIAAAKQAMPFLGEALDRYYAITQAGGKSMGRNVSAEIERGRALKLLAAWCYHDRQPTWGDWRALDLQPPSDLRAYFRPLATMLGIDLPAAKRKKRGRKSRSIFARLSQKSGYSEDQ